MPRAHPISKSGAQTVRRSSRRKNRIIDKIYDELCKEQEAGRVPDLETFCARYPSFKRSIRKLFDAHCFLVDDLNFPVPGKENWPGVGESILGFQLLQKLGEGAYARVFLAAETALGNREVVVKISGNGEAEASTLGRLNHAGIVPVHSVQQDFATGLTVVCMPYLGSATLCDVLDHAYATGDSPAQARAIREAVEERALPDRPAPDLSRIDGPWRRGRYEDGIVQIAAQLADALVFIHGLGVRHSDLKPSNVLMSSCGQAMLLDFNLSCDRELEAEWLGGTLPYMSPEQLHAVKAEDRKEAMRWIDNRSDIFSLGVILFEMLCGAHPFVEDMPDSTPAECCEQLLARQLAGPRPLRVANPRVDKALATLVERCLAYKPEERPQAAVELADALKQYQSTSRRLARVLSRNRLKMIAAAALMAAGASAVAYGVTHREPRGLRLLNEARQACKKCDYDRSEKLLTQAMVADSELSKRPDILDERGRARQQLAAATVAARDAEADPMKRRLLASEAQRRYQEAWYDHAAARDLSPGTEFAAKIGSFWASLGYCDNQMREFHKAEADYKAAIAAGFETPEVLNNLGHTCLKLNRFSDAAKYLDKAIRMNPSLQAAYHNRALLGLAETTAKLNEKDSAVYAGSPDHLKAPLAGLEKATADIEKAIELGPETAMLHWDAARIHVLAATGESQGLAFRLQRVECWLAPVHGQPGVNRSKFIQEQISAGARVLRALDRAADHWQRASDLGVNPDLAREHYMQPLASIPRFQALLNSKVTGSSLSVDTRLVDPVHDP
jgi:serine/threonine protein kinase/Flp pilus assembly protein TadD